MTSEEQTKWKGFSIIYYYPKDKKVVMSGILPEFSGSTTIENVRNFNIYDLSKVKFMEVSSSFVRVVVEGSDSFELEIMVKQMKEMHYGSSKIVELR